MFLLILLLVSISESACTSILESESCDALKECMWTEDNSCQTNTCMNTVQDSCLQSPVCSWNTCDNTCEPKNRVKSVCAKNDNFCTVKIDGKFMTEEMCDGTEGCTWDMCYDQCNQAFLVPVQCQTDSKMSCAQQTEEASCMQTSGCGWNTCDGQCQDGDLIPVDCVQRLGSAKYNPGLMQPTVRYDPKTGRRYRPYMKRPMCLNHRVWTWILALPPLCLVIFFIGFYFPQEFCDSTDADYDEYVEGQNHFSTFSGMEPIKMKGPESMSTSTLHTMLSSKAASQTRYRGPSKSRILYDNSRHVETSRSLSVDRDRGFGPSKRAPSQNPGSPDNSDLDYDYYKYVPPNNHRRDSKRRERKTEAL